MLQLLGKRQLGGLILAALAAGSWIVPALATQSASSQAHKPAHKSSSKSVASSSSSTTSTVKKSTKSGSKASTKRKSTKVKGQAAPAPERINEIQEALGRKGVYTGTPSGKWDDSTVDAMKKFQTSNGLNPTGKLDALTLQKLGLGSETAGLAAPTPPPNSANRLRNQSSAPAEPSEQ